MLISSNEREFIVKALRESELRVDGRGPFDLRPVSYRFGPKDGTCEVTLGKTRVLAVVSAELEPPAGGRGNEGRVTINVEFSPMASPNFEPGRPGEEASELAVVLERAIRETGAVDVESLCVLAGRRVWHVRCDVHVIDACGNIVGAASLAANAARECRSFVLASSGSVYGECAVDSEGEPVPSREDHPTDAPVSPYAASKRGAELMARAFASNAGGKLPVTVARIFTVYGPRGRPDMAVFRFVRAASTGGTLFRFGDGRSTWRDYTHVDDVVEGLLAALYRDAKNASSGGIRTRDNGYGGDGVLVVNVASGTPTRLGTLIEEVTRACGGDPGEVEERPGRPGDVGGTYADARRAEETLGWRAKISLREGLRNTAVWYAAEEAAPWRDPPPP